MMGTILDAVLDRSIVFSFDRSGFVRQGLGSRQTPPPREHFVARIVERLERFDDAAVARLLGDAVVGLGASAFVHEVAAPLVHRVGARWAEGELSIAAEHLLTGTLRNLLRRPELRAYAAAGLKRGLRSSLSPGVILRGVRAFRGGKRQGAMRGDPWQQGGVFIIRPGNRVDFTHISQEAGDHPAAEAILSALDKIGRKKSGASRR
jgi:hypothetical protein